MRSSAPGCKRLPHMRAARIPAPQSELSCRALAGHMGCNQSVSLPAVALQMTC